MTLDVGKQFIRWGKTDIVTPTDRFAPRTFLNVIDTEFLPVTGVRGGVRLGEARSRRVGAALHAEPHPLLDQRWAVTPPGVPGADRRDRTDRSAVRSADGMRWSHVGSRLEYAFAFFDGFNHLPDIEPVPPTRRDDSLALVRSRYPSLRSVGGDVAVPTPWFTIKGEAAYFTSATPRTDEYVLYVVQLERQAGSGRSSAATPAIT